MNSSLDSKIKELDRVESIAKELDAKAQARKDEEIVAEVADRLATGAVPDEAKAKGEEARQIILTLARLDTLEYEQARKKSADDLAIRASVLDKLVIEARIKVEGAALIRDLPIWPMPVDIGKVLTEVVETILSYVVLAKEQADAIALWIAACHAFDCFHIFPRLNLTAPEKECGKSTGLDVITELTPRALDVQNMTSATLYRLVEEYTPTLLIDEVDSFLREDSSLRGLLNAGHKRGAKVPRCEGEENKVRLFRVFAPVVLAGIGEIPGTILNRSIVIRLARAKKSEIQKRFDSRYTDAEQTLCRKLSRWATDNTATLKASNPALPSQAYNRLADNWRPLFAVAEMAGTDWPERARKAFIHITGRDDDSDSTAVQLLTDIRAIFDEHGNDRISSADLVRALTELPDRPWPAWNRGDAINQQQLAKLLKPFQIRPSVHRKGDKTPRGYDLSQFLDSFDRYLEPATAQQMNQNTDLHDFSGATSEMDVAGQKSQKPPEIQDCCTVAGPEQGNGKDEDPSMEPPAPEPDDPGPWDSENVRP